MARITKPCPVCKISDPKRPWLTCQSCGSTTHIKCMRFTEAMANEIELFHCNFCFQTKGLRSIFKQNQSVNEPRAASSSTQPVAEPPTNRNEEPIIIRIDRSRLRPQGPQPAQAPAEASGSSQSDSDPDEPEYKVTAITDVRHGEEGDEYFVTWEGGETSWEPEANIGLGCKDLVNEIRQKKEFDAIEFTSNFGAIGDNSDFDTRNWRSLEQVIEAVDRYDREPNNRLPVSLFSGQIVNSTIMLMGLKSHVYVIYRSPLSGIVYVADGPNYYIQDEEVKREIDHLLGLRATGLKFIGQSSIDHCTSSAVMIAISLRNASRIRVEPTTIKAERTRQERIMKDFHPYASKTEQAAGPLRNLEPDLCPVCGMQFNDRSRRRYTGHLLGHRNKDRKAV